MGQNILNFFKHDIWRVRLKTLPPKKSFFLKQLRIFVLSLRGFYEDRCWLRASGLTFFSLLSIVPVLAVAFGIAKGFGLEQSLEDQILAKLHTHQEVALWLVNFAHNQLENAKEGLIAGIGIIILLWSVIKLLSNIESSFNDIWGVKKGRPFFRKLSDYLSVMLICPILLMMSSGIAVIISSQAKILTQKIALLGALTPLISLFISLIPYILIWFLFTFIYLFIPNCSVKFRSSLIGGITAGTIYQIVQYGFLKFFIGVGKFGDIYGSFAALPLFLIWLQISWLILLFGAEIAFAHQNVDTYEFEPDCLKASHTIKKLLALRIVQVCVQNFSSGEKPYTASQITQIIEVPIRLVRLILFELVESGILVEIKTHDEKVSAYQPARDIDQLKVKHVLDALDQRGSYDIPFAESKELEKLAECVKQFGDTIDVSPYNLKLKDV